MLAFVFMLEEEWLSAYSTWFSKSQQKWPFIPVERGNYTVVVYILKSFFYVMFTLVVLCVQN